MKNSQKMILTAAVCLAALLAASLLTGFWIGTDGQDSAVRIGFIYSEDESTPYTANFLQAQRAMAEEYGDRVEILSRSNVQSRNCERPIQELIREGCRMIFLNLDSDVPVTLAREYPEVEFCQVSLPDVSIEGTPTNYHTFNGEIYQARYVSGIVAGMKLKELTEKGILEPGQALVGFVGANASTEVISGYTAFLLGVRSVMPEAVMRVRYTGSWGNYNAEKEQTRRLISEGCVIIGQHVNTVAPAVACEEAAAAGRTVFHVGYHQSMMDVAPSITLVSIRTNWERYMIEAVGAVLKHQNIESAVKAHAHGRDLSAGFESGWVEMLELNRLIAAEGTEEAVTKAIDGLISGKIRVFSGDYIGVSPRNPAHTIDLSKGYQENQNSSNPSFGYLLKDIIIPENSGTGE